MNKRRHQRIEVENMVAIFSDGLDSFPRAVGDISRHGMLVNDFPQSLKSLEEKLSIAVSAKGKDFKLLVVPKWVSANPSETKMGLAIVDTPLDWTVFVMNCEPEKEDIWAATTHLPGY